MNAFAKPTSKPLVSYDHVPLTEAQELEMFGETTAQWVENMKEYRELQAMSQDELYAFSCGISVAEYRALYN